MANATGTITINSSGSLFDSATYPRFVLGDGTNSLTFVIDNDARGLKDQNGNDARDGDYTITGVTFPLEDSQKGRLVVPTMDHGTLGPKKALIALEMPTPAQHGNFAVGATLAAGADVGTVFHFILTDASGSTMRIGMGASNASNLTNNGWSLVAKYGTSSPRHWVYRSGSTSDYLIRQVDGSSNETRFLNAVAQTVNHAASASLVNLEGRIAAQGTSGEVLRALIPPSSYSDDQFAQVSGSNATADFCLIRCPDAGPLGNVCSMEFRTGSATSMNTDDERRSIKYGYDEYLATDPNVRGVTSGGTQPTDSQFWGENINTKIFFRGGTIAGASASSSSLGQHEIAEAIKDMVNASVLGITATRSGSIVNLTNDTDGDSGNVDITTTNEGSLFSVTGMSNVDTSVLNASTTSSIGTGGGLVKAGNVTSDPDVQVNIPASALSGDTDIIVNINSGSSDKATALTEIKSLASVPKGARASSDVMDFQPHGQSFTSDAILSFNVTGSTSNMKIYRRANASSAWEEVDSSYYSFSGGQVHITASTF